MSTPSLLQGVLAAGAGVATVASPCVLPLLPVLLGVSTGPRTSSRPVFIIAGFVLAFVVVAVAFGASSHALGISQAGLRQTAAACLLLAGLLMVWPALGDRLMMRLGPVADIANRLGGKTSGSSLTGGLLLGMTLGALWTPCAGPVLASILALVAQSDSPAHAAPLLAAYAMGAGLPMLGIAYGGQSIIGKTRALMPHVSRIKQAFGLLVMLSAAAMLGNFDVQASAWLADQASRVKADPVVSSPTLATPVKAPRAAPEWVGIDHWLNSPPLSLKTLRGRVVLVDFWTFGCVNCVRTLPHLQQWHERYAAKGLTIVGVHTPEFGFERPLEAVRAAVKRYGLTYPIAQDNRYATWEAYNNLYWPAQYLIDKQGRIVFHHVGEGDEQEIERAIQKALEG